MEKPSSGVGCHRSLRRSEVLVQEEDYNNLAADDDENGDQKPDVASGINPVFANKRISLSTDSNSTSNSDHSPPGRPSLDSDYSVLYDKVCCIIALLNSWCSRNFENPLHTCCMYVMVLPSTKCSRIALLFNSQMTFRERVIIHQSTWKKPLLASETNVSKANSITNP